jgi:hypothetical protein
VPRVESACQEAPPPAGEGSQAQRLLLLPGKGHTIVKKYFLFAFSPAVPRHLFALV